MDPENPDATAWVERRQNSKAVINLVLTVILLDHFNFVAPGEAYFLAELAEIFKTPIHEPVKKLLISLRQMLLI